MPYLKGKEHPGFKSGRHERITVRCNRLVKAAAVEHCQQVKITLSDYIERLMKQDLNIN